MKKRYAVIDLGTNTFHLLIVEQNEETIFTELYRKRVFIKLAENGIQTIGNAPFQRGVEALKFFKNILNEYEVSDVTAFGTAALRTASNGNEFIAEIAKTTDIQIQLIPGQREAELIYKGVIQAIGKEHNHGLIMDIGGGSVEFILFNKSGIQWAQSFPVGVAVLFNNFQSTDPISNDEVSKLNTFLTKTLSPLLIQLKKYPPNKLIGASGTFDVLENILCKEKISPFHGVVDVLDFAPLYTQLLQSSLPERLKMADIPETRAEMIIVALILIDFVIQQAPIESISVSAYAMKEGMLAEIMA